MLQLEGERESVCTSDKHSTAESHERNEERESNGVEE